MSEPSATVVRSSGVSSTRTTLTCFGGLVSFGPLASSRGRFCWAEAGVPPWQAVKLSARIVHPYPTNHRQEVFESQDHKANHPVTCANCAGTSASSPDMTLQLDRIWKT